MDLYRAAAIRRPHGRSGRWQGKWRKDFAQAIAQAERWQTKEPQADVYVVSDSGMRAALEEVQRAGQPGLAGYGLNGNGPAVAGPFFGSRSQRPASRASRDNADLLIRAASLGRVLDALLVVRVVPLAHRLDVGVRRLRVLVAEVLQSGFIALQHSLADLSRCTRLARVVRRLSDADRDHYGNCGRDRCQLRWSPQPRSPSLERLA
jgi:hypothetical protein